MRNVRRTNFPWIASNLRYKEGKIPIAGGQESYIIKKNGLKVIDKEY